MISITKLNGQVISVNDDLIETIEETPNTVITLTNGKKIIVKEKIDDIIDRIIYFRKKVRLEDIIK